MDVCKICGHLHSSDYDKDAKTLVKAIQYKNGDGFTVNFTLEGGVVNIIGAEILLKHALHIVVDTPEILEEEN